MARVSRVRREERVQQFKDCGLGRGICQKARSRAPENASQAHFLPSGLGDLLRKSTGASFTSEPVLIPSAYKKDHPLGGLGGA